MKIINHIEDNLILFEDLEVGDVFCCPHISNSYYIKMQEVICTSNNKSCVLNAFELNNNRCISFNKDNHVYKLKTSLHIEKIV